MLPPFGGAGSQGSKRQPRNAVISSLLRRPVQQNQFFMNNKQYSEEHLNKKALNERHHEWSKVLNARLQTNSANQPASSCEKRPDH